MMRMAEMVKKMLNQKMPKMLLNQPLRTIAMVLVLALVLAPSSSSMAQETLHDVDTHRLIVYIYVSYVYVYDKCLGRIYIYV